MAIIKGKNGNHTFKGASQDEMMRAQAGKEATNSNVADDSAFVDSPTDIDNREQGKDASRVIWKTNYRRDSVYAEQLAAQQQFLQRYVTTNYWAWGAFVFYFVSEGLAATEKQSFATELKADTDYSTLMCYLNASGVIEYAPVLSEGLQAIGTMAVSDMGLNQTALYTLVGSTVDNLGSGTLSDAVTDSAVQQLDAADSKTAQYPIYPLVVADITPAINNSAIIGNPTVTTVVEDTDVTADNLIATGTISISDADQNQSAFTTSVVSAADNLGTLVIAADGTYTYLVANSAVQSLAAGMSKLDSFTLSAVDGTTKVISFTIQGVNDTAVIGSPTVTDMTEDANVVAGNLTVTGTIAIADPDQDQAVFNTSVTPASGNLGSLVLAADGTYTYLVANSAVQSLAAGASKVDSFTLFTADGTSKVVSFVIQGSNDAPVTTDVLAEGNEDTASVMILLTGSDVDGHIDHFAIKSLAQQGALYKDAALTQLLDINDVVNATGGVATVYFVPNANFHGAADFQYVSVDNTGTASAASTAHIEIAAINDPAIIGNPTNTEVSEDLTTATDSLVASGTLAISDVDQNEAAFTTVTPVAGNLGALTLAADGSYTYAVANSAVQYLHAGEIRTDKFVVSSVDGTTKQISFDIHGTDDAAVIGAPTLSEVTQDVSVTAGNLVAMGSITINDADHDQNSFQTEVVSKEGNLGSLVLLANGEYSYSVANSAVQYLAAGESQVDTFTIFSADGTQQDISFTIHGTDDMAVIGEPIVADSQVTEDSHEVAGYLEATGSISISDADQGQSVFETTVHDVTVNIGSLVLAADGSYTYTVANSAVQYLRAGESREEVFMVSSVDGTTQQVSFTIHGADDMAVIGEPTVADSQVTEDSHDVAGYLEATGSISISDADQGQSIFETTVHDVTVNIGSLVLAADGSYTYTVANSAVQYLRAGESREEVFTVSSVDGTTQQVSFTIYGADDAAVIGDPSISAVMEDTHVTAGDVVATGTIAIADADDNQNTFQTTVTAAAENLGSLTLAADGSYTYTVANSAIQYLAALQTHTDIFTVFSEDGSSKQISFTIHGANDAPVTVDVSVEGNEDAASILIELTATDVDGSVAEFVLKDLPSNGVLKDANGHVLTVGSTITAISGSAAVYFTPNPDFYGNAEFSYVGIDDTGVESAASTASLQIAAVNDAPVTQGVSVEGNEDASSISIALTGHDVDGVMTEFVIKELPSNGVLKDANGHVLSVGSTVTATDGSAAVYFIPDADFYGNAEFSYVGVDDAGAESAASTASIQVAAVNDAPVTQGISTEGNEDASSIVIALTGHDVDGIITVFVIKELPSNGVLKDANGHVLTVGSTITATNDSATVYFTPNPDFYGNAEFSYVGIDDAGVESVPSIAFMQIGAVNDAPVTHNISVEGNEDAASILIELTATDVDGSIAEFVIKELPSNGVLKDANGHVLSVGSTVTATDGSAAVYFIPDADFYGNAEFSYVGVDDAGAESAASTASIQVAAVNDAPVTQGISTEGNEDASSIVIALTGHDVDGIITVFVIKELPSNGVLKDANGHVLTVGSTITATNDSATVYFTPNPDFYGNAEFSYVGIDDAGVESVPSIAFMQIGAVNDAPVTDDVSAEGNEGASSILIELTGHDVDDTIASFVIKDLPANGVLKDSNGNILSIGSVITATGASAIVYFTPTSNFSGDSAFSYAVQNSAGVEDTTPAQAIIHVNPVNDAPTGTNNTIEVEGSRAFTLADFGFSDATDTLANAFLAVQITSLPVAGTLKHNGNAVAVGDFISAADINSGLLTFNVSATSASFTFKVQDDGGTVNGGVDLAITPNTITLLAVTPPVANTDFYLLSNLNAYSMTDPLQGVLGNDTGGNLSATLIESTRQGALTFNADGTFSYTPFIYSNANAFDGRDFFTYTATNSAGESSMITVQFAVSLEDVFTLTPLASDEIIVGSNTVDFIRGGDGNDVIYGFEGSDRLMGDAGDDILIGAAGTDMLSGGPGNDTYIFDTDEPLWTDIITEVSTNGGTDTLDFSASSNDITINLNTAGGLTGAAPVAASTQIVNANLSLSITVANRQLLENVITGSGNDLIILSSATNVNNVYSGGLGDDIYRAGFSWSGVDTINDTGGFDTLDFSFLAYDNVNYGVKILISATGALSVTDRDNTPLGDSVSNATFTGQFEKIIGTDGADSVTSLGNFDEVFVTNMSVGAVLATIPAGLIDSWQGGGGNDTYIVMTKNAVKVSIDDSSGNDTVDFSQLSDPIAEGVTVDLQNGVSWISIAGVENVVGTSLGDMLSGAADANTLTGLAGADTLDGRGGNDTLLGGAGDDTIIGGTGNDTLTGGADNDTFVFTNSTIAANNTDTITDFQSSDKVQLSVGALFEVVNNTYGDVQINVAVVGGGIQQIILQGINSIDINNNIVLV
jgi:VCBS repeat-containing protein